MTFIVWGSAMRMSNVKIHKSFEARTNITTDIRIFLLTLGNGAFGPLDSHTVIIK